MDIEPLVNTLKTAIADNLWVVQVLAVLLITLLINLLQKSVFNHLQQRFKKTKTLWDESLIAALRTPVALIIWIIGVLLSFRIIESNVSAAVSGSVEKLRDIGIVIAFAWFLLRLIKLVQKNHALKQKKLGITIDQGTANAITKILDMLVIIIAALVAMQVLGFSISGLLAFGGISGIVIGFAAKDLLANFFGGFVIYLDRPFVVGDWVRSPDIELEGTVEKIGWRQTTIRTFDKRPLYVPNATFARLSVENPSRMSHRRIYETIGIRYEDIDKMEKILTETKIMLEQHPDIDNTQTMMVNFNKFAPSSLDFFVYTFTKTTDWVEYHKIKQDILLRISHIIRANSAEIAFPTSTVHIQNLDS